MKTKIFLSALFILALSTFFLSKSVNAQDELPFNIKVLQPLSTNPAPNVMVEFLQNGQVEHIGFTDENGIIYYTAAAGTYDIYVYKPAPPNDTQSSQLLGHYHGGDETVTLTLGAWY